MPRSESRESNFVAHPIAPSLTIMQVVPIDGHNRWSAYVPRAISMPRDKRLRSLAALHFVTGLIAGYLATIGSHAPNGLSGILLVPLVALVPCQAFLLALWGVTSTASPWKRIPGLLAGSVYLDMLWLLVLEGELPGTSTVTIAVATASLVVVRAMGGKFTRQVHNAPHGQPATGRLKFSIRSLLLLTAAFAVLSAVVRAFPPENRLTPFIVFLSLCFVTIGFVALWAVSGKARPLERAAVVLVLSPILGVLVVLASNARGAGRVYIILSMLLNSVTMLVSLFVVRSCGYRFARRA
jgi:hypothetical protein